MQISMWVPYDEKRLRRTINFILKPQMRVVRVCGGIIAVMGLLLVAVDRSSVIGYACAFLGLFFALALGPLSISRSVRLQSNVIKDGLHMTLDNEAITVTYPLVESRFKWAGSWRRPRSGTSCSAKFRRSPSPRTP